MNILVYVNIYLNLDFRVNFLSTLLIDLLTLCVVLLKQKKRNSIKLIKVCSDDCNKIINTFIILCEKCINIALNQSFAPE